MNRALYAGLIVAVLSMGGIHDARAARDAAFMNPGASVSRSGAVEEGVAVEPKPEVDVGDTPINVGRRATFFFVNRTNMPAEIETITANGDSNVRADIVADDCTKEGKIVPGSRCSVTVETTPTGVGSWTAELMMTHKAVGRIARARITGKTSGGGSMDKASMGLSLSTKDIKPVDFGDIELGTGKAVRSALMINDSNEVISLLSIEVIAAENGLQRLEQGCMEDMELKMGESCPVTLLWKPEARGIISTDLIIRHTGRLGFAVIPIRGVAKESKTENGTASSPPSGSKGVVSPASSSGSQGIPLPPTADEIEKMMSGKIMPLPSDALPPSMEIEPVKAKKAKGTGSYHLIGTVGSRAVIFKPDGTTAIVGVGETIDDSDGDGVKVTNIQPKSAEIFVDGEKKTLKLQAVSSLTAQANRDRAAASAFKSVKDRKGSEETSRKSSGAEGQAVPLPTGR